MAEGSSKWLGFGFGRRGYPAGSGDEWKSALDDPDVVEVSAAEAAGWSSSGRQMRKLAQAVSSDIIELDADDDPDGVMIIDEKIIHHKNKKAVVRIDWPEHAKSGMSADFGGPSAIPVTKFGPWDGLGGYHINFASPIAIPATKDHNNFASPSAIPVTKVGPWDGLGGYHNNVTGPSAIPATKFYPWDGLTLAPYYYDQSDVAPGEEHNKSYSNSTPLMENGTSFNSGANNYMGIPPGVETVLPQVTSADMPHQPSQTEIVNIEVHKKYKTFKKFDTVNGNGDHLYSLPGKSKVHAVKKAWVKRIQHEWKLLENDLPASELPFWRIAA